MSIMQNRDFFMLFLWITYICIYKIDIANFYVYNKYG